MQPQHAKSYQIPVKRPDVVESLDEQKLVLTRNNHRYSCAQEEGLLWSLINANSTRAAVIFQWQQVCQQVGVKSEKSGDALIAQFVEMKLLEFVTVPVPEFPLQTDDYSHIASTRGGIYLFNQDHYLRLARGMFFGLCFDSDLGLLAYEFPHPYSSLWRKSFQKAKQSTKRQEGVVLRWPAASGELKCPELAFTGLGNNLHHLQSTGDHLVGVDTDNARLCKIFNDGEMEYVNYPGIKKLNHLNSLVAVEQGWLLMCPIDSFSFKTSAFMRLNTNFEILERHSLDASMAHDFLPDEDATSAQPSFWFCNSADKSLAHYPSRQRIEIPATGDIIGQPYTVRGLASAGDELVVGTGMFGAYYKLANADIHAGAANWVDPLNGQVNHTLALPEAPCCIINNPFYK